jgi:N6-L-threonylcarbamoyladenine synthase
MMILGIESSCDETAAAVLLDNGELASDVLYSQVPIHAPYGGIVPELASRAHLQKIRPVVDAALEQAGVGLDDVQAIAVTRGPGLVGSLLVGISYAKALGYVLARPVVGIHHLEGHLLAPFLGQGSPRFPFVALVVSGGHTSLYLARGLGDYLLLGRTRDDAAGEAFDKGAKLLGLGYPGGPVIAERAEDGDPKAVRLPRGMWAKGGLDTSFSGLKTALYNHVRSEGAPRSEGALADLCASLQEAIVDALIHKTDQALKQHAVERLVVSGGVAANERLRARSRELARRRGVELCVAPPHHCTDNGAMIALAGQLRFEAGLAGDTAALELTADSSWELGVRA